MSEEAIQSPDERSLHVAVNLPEEGLDEAVKHPDESVEDVEARHIALLEKIKNMPGMDYVREYGPIVGAAAVGAAAGYLFSKYSNRKFELPDGSMMAISKDRHKPNTIALVQVPRRGGKIKNSNLAISLPVDSSAAERLKKGYDKVALFAIQLFDDSDNLREVPFAYPLRDEEKHISQYGKVTRTAAGWIANAIRSRRSVKPSSNTQ